MEERKDGREKPSLEEELGFSGHDGDDNALFCRFAAAGIMSQC